MFGCGDPSHHMIMLVPAWQCLCPACACLALFLSCVYQSFAIVHSYVKAQSIEPGNPKLKARVRNARRQLAINLEMKHEIDLYDSASVKEDEAAIAIQVRDMSLSPPRQMANTGIGTDAA